MVPMSPAIEPKVTVIVVAHNGGQSLLTAVKSIIANRHVMVTVMVVDNASTDDSLKALTSVPAPVIPLNGNLGYGAAFNAGLARVETPWVVCANQDVVVPPDALERLIREILNSETNTAAPIIAGPRIVDSEGRTQETCHALPSLRRECMELLFGSRFGSRNAISDKPIQDAATAGWLSAVFIVGRTTTFRLIGGFDPTYFMYAEDLDLFRRLHDAGGRCLWNPEVTITHDGGVHSGRPISGELYGLTLYNIGAYYQNHARHAASAQRMLVLMAAAFGALTRCIFWLSKAALSVARAPALANPAMRQSLKMSRMFAVGARIAMSAAITQRRPSSLSSLRAP